MLDALLALALAAADAPVTAATVYSRGARITRTANVQVEGASAIELPLLPMEVDPGSIRVESDDAEVRRVDVARVDAVSFPADDARKLLDQLDALDDARTQLDGEVAARAQLVSIFTALRPRAPEDLAGRPPPKLDPSSWGASHGFVASWLDKLQAMQRDAQDRIAELERQRGPILARAQQLEASRHGGWRVTANLAGHGAAALRLGYDTTRAAWIPVYDLQLDPAHGVVQVDLAGQLSQQTGEDWNDVQLTLSTALPAATSALPELATWKIGERERFIPTPYAALPPPPPPPPVPARPIVRDDAARLEQRLLERIAGRNRAQNTTPVGTERYEEDDSEAAKEERPLPKPAPPPPPPMPTMSAPSPAPARASDTPAAEPEAPRGGSVALDEISLEGSADKKIAVTGVGLEAPPGYAVRRDPGSAAALAGGRSLAYRALRKESLPSGGGARRVALLATRWPVSVERRIFPALTEDVFLAAELKSPEKQALPGGAAHLFVGADPAGVAELDVMAPGETFALPLGVDRALKPVRNVKLEQAEKGLISKDDVTDYRVTIELANPYGTALDARVFDQWPLSSEPHVEIQLLETTPYAAQDKVTGKLEWRITLPPRQTTTLVFRYRIRRPKNWRLTQ